MRIYGLYGKSGTGKSHKATKVMNDLHIHAVIDDGLLIINKRKVAGKSAKNEPSLIAATKRATFSSDYHRDEVYTYLKKAHLTSLLIIGTSKKMIRLIVARLELSKDITWISIESYQTSKELQLAQQKRAKNFHVIPINPDEITNIFSGKWVKKLLIKLGKRNEYLTLVKPIYQQKNKIIITPQCVKDIVAISSIPTITIQKIQLEYEKVIVTVLTHKEHTIHDLMEWRNEVISILYNSLKINYTIDIKWRSFTSKKHYRWLEEMKTLSISEGELKWKNSDWIRASGDLQ